ncbi:MAG: GIY-YIG nuclease family protein [Chthonomonadetes bacterium]|nr:GIY-YIG nuclease family protein [Chthonomonadetes bacterium]
MIDPSSIPNTPGIYQLVLWLPETVTLQVGRLGMFTFPAGRYIYTGSAMGGLRARIARHLRAEKRLRWHIDYFLPYAVVQDIRVYPSSDVTECALNAQTLSARGARVVASGFGSSDCRCPAHLVYLGAGVPNGSPHPDPLPQGEGNMARREPRPPG